MLFLCDNKFSFLDSAEILPDCFNFYDLRGTFAANSETTFLKSFVYLGADVNINI